MVAAVDAGDVSVRFGSGPLEGKVERRPVPHPPFGPHPSAVAVDDALHRGQPKTGSHPKRALSTTSAAPPAMVDRRAKSKRPLLLLALFLRER